MNILAYLHHINTLCANKISAKYQSGVCANVFYFSHLTLTY